MSKPINDPLEFLAQLCAAIEDKYPLDGMEGRRCVIVRCPANYGTVDSVIISWEGSPPHWTIFVSGMHAANSPAVLVVWGKIVSDPPQREKQANDLILRFLEAHPANEDGSPVWIEPESTVEL